MKQLSSAALILMISLSSCASHYYNAENELLHLYLKKPGANNVLFACSLDCYELHQAEKISKNTWKVTLRPANEFSYFYIIDGSVFVPECIFTEEDDFGSQICIYESNL